MIIAKAKLTRKSKFIALELVGNEVENFLAHILLRIKLIPFVSMHCNC